MHKTSPLWALMLVPVLLQAPSSAWAKKKHHPAAHRAAAGRPHSAFPEASVSGAHPDAATPAVVPAPAAPPAPASVAAPASAPTPAATPAAAPMLVPTNAYADPAAGLPANDVLGTPAQAGRPDDANGPATAYANALRLGVRFSYNILEVEYERALTRSLGLYVGVGLPIVAGISTVSGSLSTYLLGGSIGARYYTVNSNAPFSGLYVNPYFSMGYIGFSGDAATRQNLDADGKLYYSGGAALGYGWTPAERLNVVVAFGLAYTSLSLPGLNARFSGIGPALSLGLGPLF